MEKNFKRNIVVSGINLVNSGSFAILRECLGYLSENLSDLYNVIALVHKKALLKIDNITYYEFPDSRKSWGRRLYYEYVYFKRLSKKLRPYLWLSLHDMTPNVHSEILAVYCHNPAPFYKISYKELLVSPKFTLFNLFYKYLYMINIRKNNFVIVQQSWIRERFISLFNVNNVIVSYPSIDNDFASTKEVRPYGIDKTFVFFYPAFPRLFKNFDIICEAAKILTDNGNRHFEVYLTLDGKENKYSRFIYNQYKSIDRIKFVGLLTQEQVYNYYSKADCLIFPSKLETWGMPITEFKNHDKPLLLADLEYAHETIGDYDKVRFFDPRNPRQLSGLMKDIMENRLVFESVKSKEIEPPFAADWKELFDILFTVR